MATKRKAETAPEAQEGGRNTVEVIPLGAAQEVGRSCVLLKYMCAPVLMPSSRTAQLLGYSKLLLSSPRSLYEHLRIVPVSCRGKTVMLDCGVHPGRQGLASLPFLDEANLDEVDAALITHFHLDHCAAVPYLLTRTNFKV